jgi:hypothetical protein
MNIEIPADLNRIERIAYQIGAQTFLDNCLLAANKIFPSDPMRSDDLTSEFFETFMDVADQRIRFAMDTLAVHGGYVTAKNFQDAARRAIITMAPWITLEHMLLMKEDDLVNG